MGKRRSCKGTTRAGNACQNAPLRDGDYCLAHDRKEKEARGFGGPQPGSGRPRKPRADDLVREAIEAELAEWLAVLSEAREATYRRMIGYGDDATVVEEDDHRTRLKAFAVAFDRAFGRPRQPVDVGGRDDAPPIQLEHAFADPDTRKALDGIVRRVAAARAGEPGGHGPRD